MFDSLVTIAETAIWILAIMLGLVASAHAVLRKREVRAAIGWVAVIWLVPVVGAILYGFFGINRIRRKARLMRAETRRYRRAPHVTPVSPQEVGNRLREPVEHLEDLARFVERITTRPLLPGNQIAHLVNGDQAYPAMLEEIDGAQKSISLATYIFDSSPVAFRFIDALERAHKRGIAVRVLLDDIGYLYHGGFRSIRELKRRQIPVALFMRARPFWQLSYFNLRNHRKTLVIDGQVGFTGGMNIQRGHLLSANPPDARQDLHFRIRGPVVAQLQDVFAEDWEFTTHEPINGEIWYPRLTPEGTTMARGIADGPDDDFDKVRWTFLGAIACARSSIRIVTPYFLPDLSIITALGVAATRGVRVDIVVPQKSDHLILQWAIIGQIGVVLDGGCRVWLSPPPFDHSKLMIVDEEWLLFGSPNWDARSLRLNFEFAVECYDSNLAVELSHLVEQRIRASNALTREDLDDRSLPIQLRDGVARLFEPYL
jgi:cardiolipin synthase A/B